VFCRVKQNPNLISQVAATPPKEHARPADASWPGRAPKRNAMSRIDDVNTAVAQQVALLPNLTDEQRERVQEIASAFAAKNQGRQVSFEGIANLVRSQAERLTPNTLAANGGKL
jgi:hypothetical protein